MKTKISKRAVDAMVVGDIMVDTEIRGFVARRLKSGAVTYGFRYYDAGGRERWTALGLHGSITPNQARVLARKRSGEVADGRDPVAEQEIARTKTANTVNAVLDAFLLRYVRDKERPLRSAETIESAFARCVRPRLGETSIYELRRGDIVAMLDATADENGPVMADRVLAYLRKALNWQATRDDRFNSPVVKGMARTRPKERARGRVLSDEEIRDLWTGLDKADLPACYPPFVKTLLLTGQRRSEVSGASWTEIDDQVWTIPAERYKTKREHEVPLTDAMLALFGEPQKAGFVFSSDGGNHAFSGFSKSKRELDARIAVLRKRDGHQPMPHWTLHDLRRSARSLMSRAAVSADVAERVLGHVIGGVRETYDRHGYLTEKRDALERLAGLIHQILNPTAKVVAFPKSGIVRP